MSKQITPQELAEIVTKLLTTDEIDDHDTFAGFFTRTAELVCEFCGGEISRDADMWIGKWLVGINANDSLPPGGGVWKDYDLEGEL